MKEFSKTATPIRMEGRGRSLPILGRCIYDPWILLECSAQTAKGVLAKGDPRLQGIGIACDWIDPDDGQPKAALECVR